MKEEQEGEEGLRDSPLEAKRHKGTSLTGVPHTGAAQQPQQTRVGLRGVHDAEVPRLPELRKELAKTREEPEPEHGKKVALSMYLVQHVIGKYVVQEVRVS